MGPRRNAVKSARSAIADRGDLAASHGLQRVGARPGLFEYSRQMWRRRHFVSALSRATFSSGYSRTHLGQAWQLLTPLLDAAVYYAIFGVLLSTRRGVDNYIAFLVVGVFAFRFTQSSVLSGARAVSGNTGLIRALHFPRAVLPVSGTAVNLYGLLASMAVLLPIVVLTGESPSLRWLQLLPALGLQTLFCLGLSCIAARVGARVPDLTQILPFLLRIWLYVSGVFYSIDVLAGTYGYGVVRNVLTSNPGALFVDLTRDALISGNRHLSSHDWLYASGWAILVAVLGYVYFWRSEDRYGLV